MECPYEILPPIRDMYLQSTDIKDKFIVFTILYSHGPSTAVQKSNRVCLNLASHWS